ncbi:MAG: amidohydrolase [Blautia sp.]|nr:amidohydrolase [Blautia sp.]MCM1201485.1 amidohydrolase [Bacteroides fragilis]
MDRTVLEKELRDAFYWFHEHPELAYEEVRTTGKIREILTVHGIEILPYQLETGLVAVIRGEKEGSVRALRCDIDALPVTEETDLSYRSKETGKMHACGHDMHIAAGIGCAVLLHENRERLHGTVRIIFQPAEETSLGALKILETDAMEDVEKIWGFHADPTNGAGTVAIREGYVTAAVDRFVITVKGVGCHGAHPDNGIDPILVAAAVIQALQSIVSRNVNAFHPSLLSVTRVSAGTTWNVIPAEAVMEGTVRTMEREDRSLYGERLQEIAEKTAQAYGAEAEVEWIAGPPAVRNDKKMADFCRRKAEEMGRLVAVEESSMGGDDFAFYEEKVPGCYVKLGTGVGHPIHHPAFRVEPEMLFSAAEFLSACLEES